MRGEPRDFWGKLGKDDHGNVVAWHPLVDHCADVAACFESLLRTTSLGRRLARLGGRRHLTEVQLQRLCVLAALHDAGKFNHGFQAKARGEAGAGHVAEVLYLFDSDDGAKLGAAIGIEELARWGEGRDTTCELLIASFCHHGRPLLIGRGSHAHLWQKRGDRDPFAGIRDLLAQSRVWFPRAFAAGGEPLPARPAFQHAFSGLVMLADWLGSDTAFFPFADERGNRVGMAREWANRALAHVGLDPRPARAVLQQGVEGFARISPHEPRPAQRAVDGLALPREGTLVVLEAETGSGKTEAALAHFVRQLRAGAVDGMYFALPTRTAATQIHRRVVEALERAIPDQDARPPVVLGVSGYITVDDRRAQRLAGFEVLWNDDDPHLWRARGWAAENAKRYLAGAVTVGTIDQVLLSSLQVSHAHLRASALLRQLLVVDEVHASDAYMNRILEDVLDRHLRAGGHALLMSATLGARARTRFLCRARNDHPSVPGLEEAVDAPFPQLVVASTSQKAQTVPIRTNGDEKRVAVELCPLMNGPERVVALALRAALEGARVLVLRNTVRGALETQPALEAAAAEAGHEARIFCCSGLAAPHHARFARTDRQALDEAIEARFGRGRDAGGCVAVSTQTVQQSLDLDADLLVTDLCPMDVLLQRVGRLHRHPERRRPAGFEEPRLFVLTPPDRNLGELIGRNGRACGDHGLGTVYEDLRVLEASWRTLEQHGELVIPAMNRSLVEAATHPQVLEEIGHCGGKEWQRHAMYVEGKASAEKGVAAVNSVDWRIPFGDSRSAFPTDLHRRIQTRLGEGDRRLEFAVPFPAAFGGEVSELTLPAWWARDAAADAPCHAEPREDASVRITFAGRTYLYDRWGLRPETPGAVPEEDEADA